MNRAALGTITLKGWLPFRPSVQDALDRYARFIVEVIAS